ncbi:hypothetical protein [Sulfurimonas sp.]|uniref:hypothetical protein n=1 Tax=Sulfurimonas sp. TaxID=2022749 RepID=UPI003D0CC52C
MDSSKNIAPYLIILSTLGYGLNILFQRYLTHHLEPHIYGDFAIGINVLEIVVTLLLLGTELSVIKFLPLFTKEQDELIFFRWNLAFLKKPLLLFLFFLAIASLVFFILQDQFESFLKEELHISLTMLFIAPFSMFYALFLSYLDAKSKVLQASLINSVARYIFLFLFFMLTLSISTINPTTIVLIYSATYTILAFVTLKIYTHKSTSINLLESFF